MWSWIKALKPEESKEDIKSIEGIFPKVMGTNEIKNGIYKIKKWEDKINRRDLKYNTKNAHMIFNNMKRKDLLVKVFILLKLT